MMQLRLQREDLVDYQVARHNWDWSDHIARTYVTAGLIAWLKPVTAIDPACGDGSLLLNAYRLSPISSARLSDISVPNVEGLRRDLPDGWLLEVGDIVKVLDAQTFTYDVIVLTEILEHVEHPEELLRLARRCARFVVASSPEMRLGQLDVNPEHLWQFDGDGYHQLLVGAGWTPMQKTHLGFHNEYDFQIWVAR